MVLRALAAAAVAAALIVIAAAAPSGASTSASGSADILLAFDTTGSMAPSIDATKRDVQSVLDSVGNLIPDARFAVASFRDRYYPGGSYSLLSPMTRDRTTLVKAINTLKAVGTLDRSKDTNAEAYNLLFNKTYTDGHIGWRSSARKLVIVIGDAEPHSAGSDGIPGCADKTPDWDGLDTRTELGKMRAAKLTLVLIRQASTATVSLACYQSLASLSYDGGAAVDGGSEAITAPIVALVKQSYAPLTVKPQLSFAVAGKTDGLTVRVVNPNAFALQVKSLTVDLPTGVSALLSATTGSLPRPVLSGRELTWSLTAPVPPFQARTAHVVLRTARGAKGTASGRLSVVLANGQAVTTTAAGRISTVRVPHQVSVSLDGAHGSAVSITGAVNGPLGAGALRGRLVAQTARGKVTLAVSALSARAIGAPTMLSGRLRVTASSVAGCVTGGTGSISITDSDALRAGTRTADALRIKLPATCGGVLAFADASGGLRVSVGFR